jgi:hypothetical protein
MDLLYIFIVAMLVALVAAASGARPSRALTACVLLTYFVVISVMEGFQRSEYLVAAMALGLMVMIPGTAGIIAAFLLGQALAPVVKRIFPGLDFRLTSTESTSRRPKAPPAATLRSTDIPGRCPNCSTVIPLDSAECPHCKAVFSDDAAWQVIPLKTNRDNRAGR